MKFDFIIDVLSGAIKLACPKKAKEIPEVIWDILKDVFPAVVTMVQELRSTERIKGSAKLEATTSAVRTMLDEGFDNLPWWSDLGEAQRDRIIIGQTELVYQLAKAALPANQGSGLSVDQREIILDGILKKDFSPLMAAGVGKRLLK